MHATRTIPGLPLEEPLDAQLGRLLDVLRAAPDRPVLIGPDGTLDGAGFLRSVTRLAAELQARGAGPGSPVAILTAPDRVETITARHAANRLGAPVVHLRSANARSDRLVMPVAAQERVVRALGVTLLVVDAGDRDRADELRARVPGLTTVAVDEVTVPDPCLSDLAAHPWQPEETAVVYLTSGTTGTPRLVPHSARGRAALVRSATGPSARDYRPVLLAVTPVSHTISTMADAVLLEGGTVVLAPDAGAEEILGAIDRHGVTDLYLPVPALYRCVERLRGGPAPFPTLRRVTYSGTVAAPGRIAEARRVLGERLNQLYGSTEAGGITSLAAIDHLEPLLLGSVGRPFPWVALRIDDGSATGSDGPAPAPGTVGEVVVRSPTVMRGWLDESGTLTGVDDDGWCRTGDLGHLDEYGYLHLTGRVGEVVKAHGIKIHPSAVARVLCDHPAVADAAVYGVRDDDLVEALHAAVELRDGRTTSTAELADHVATGLTAEHVPARITLQARLPRTASGKPDVACLRDQEVPA